MNVSSKLHILTVSIVCGSSDIGNLNNKCFKLQENYCKMKYVAKMISVRDILFKSQDAGDKN